MTASRPVLFLHGFASSTQSVKARFFRQRFEAFPAVQFHAIESYPTPRDFEHVTTTGLIDRLRQYILDHDLAPVRLIGSSYGGLICLRYAHRFGGIQSMLLLAPAVRWLSGGLSPEQLDAWKAAGAMPVHHAAFQQDVAVRYDLQVDGLRYLEPVPPSSPTVIIHGAGDLTAPASDSRAYAAEYPGQVRLVEVDADHDLNGHLDLIWDHVQSFLLHT